MEITLVTEENRRYFAPLMPDSLWKRSDLAIGAVEDGTACAVLTAGEEDTVLKITGLFVAEPFRERGIASALLDTLNRLAREEGFDMAVFEFESSEETHALESCLEKNLFVRDEYEDRICRVRFGDLQRELFHKDEPEAGKKTIPLSEVSLRMWRRFAERVRRRAGEEDDAVRILPRERYDPEVSCLLPEGETPAGGLLFERKLPVYFK